MSDKAYVVVGEEGEYSDYRMWLVKAFAHKEGADALVAILTKEVKHMHDQCQLFYRSRLNGEAYEKGYAALEADARAREESIGLRGALVEDYGNGTVQVRDEAKFSVHELPWDTTIAGGIKK